MHLKNDEEHSAVVHINIEEILRIFTKTKKEKKLSNTRLRKHNTPEEKDSDFMEAYKADNIKEICSYFDYLKEKYVDPNSKRKKYLALAIAALLNSAAKSTIKDHYKHDVEELIRDDYKSHTGKFINHDYKRDIEELIHHPLCDINQRNKDKQALIHQAVYHSNNVLLTMLLTKEDIDVNALDSCEVPPIHRAIMHNDKEIFDTLVTKEGIDLNLVCRGFLPIARAIRLKRAELLTKLLEKEGLNFSIQTKSKLPLIHYLVRWYDPKVWEVVMQGTKNSKNKIDVNAKDSYGDTALHWALYQREHSEKVSIEVINNLLDHKDINVNINADRLYTPFHVFIASKSFNEELCLKLLRHKSLKVDN